MLACLQLPLSCVFLSCPFPQTTCVSYSTVIRVPPNTCMAGCELHRRRIINTTRGTGAARSKPVGCMANTAVEQWSQLSVKHMHIKASGEQNHVN